MNTEASVTHGKDYTVSQLWAKAVYDHPQNLDGILYTSRHDETTFSLALFERAKSKVSEGISHPLSDTDVRTLRLLDHYEIGLER